MIMKLAIITFSVLFYCCVKKEKLNCVDFNDIIVENINEGDLNNEEEQSIKDNDIKNIEMIKRKLVF